MVFKIFILQIVGFLSLFLLRIIGWGGSLLFEQILGVSVFLVLLVTIELLLIHKSSKSRMPFETLICSALIASMLFFTLAQFSLLNIDRSRSFYILSWIDNGSMRVQGGLLILDKVKSNEKMNQEAIWERIQEQRLRGLVSVQNSELELTSKGELLLSFANLLGKIFHLENWRVNKH